MKKKFKLYSVSTLVSATNQYKEVINSEHDLLNFQKDRWLYWPIYGVQDFPTPGLFAVFAVKELLDPPLVSILTWDDLKMMNKKVDDNKDVLVSLVN